MRRICSSFLAIAALLASGSSTHAAFHFMQIEQVIGGVNGDTTAQAIQLRMRSSSQNQVQASRLIAVDASGANPVLLEDMMASVPNSQSGRRVLITTPNFAKYTNIPLVSDFTMDPIPVSYLAAGQLRFNDDFGTIYWSLSWGGTNFTGSTTANSGITNDNNGDYGPPVAGALPTSSLQALQFTGSAIAASTTNLADYALTAGAATFINNANTSFTLVTPVPEVLPGDFNGDEVVDAADYTVWRDNLDTTFNLSGNGDEIGDSAGIVDSADYSLWKTHFGETPDMGSGSASAGVFTAVVPEPAAGTLLIAAALLSTRRRKNRQPHMPAR